MQVNRILTIVLVILPMLLLGMTMTEIDLVPQTTISITSTAPEATVDDQLSETGSSSITVITSNNEWDDEQHQVYTVAYPHFVFQDDETSLHVFPEVLPDEIYAIESEENGIRFRTYWHGLWQDDVYGIANVSQWVEVKHQSWDDYETWDWTSTEDYEGWGPSFVDEYLDLTILFDASGQYSLKLTVEMTGYLDDGEAYRYRDIEHEMTIHVFSPKSYSSADIGDLQPAFGELEYAGIFVNWQLWDFGPCNLSSIDNEIESLLDSACQAITNDEIDALIQILETVLDMSQDELLDARIRGQLGILHMFAENWDVASRYFRTALDYWRVNDNAKFTTGTLHNLAIVYILTERYNYSQHLFVQSATVNGLIENNIASWLSWLQLAVIWEEWDSLAEAMETFDNLDLQQAEAFEHLIAMNE